MERKLATAQHTWTYRIWLYTTTEKNRQMDEGTHQSARYLGNSKKKRRKNGAGQDTSAEEQIIVGAQQSINVRHKGTNGIEGTREKDGETSCHNSVGQSIGINKHKLETFGDIMLRPLFCSGSTKADKSKSRIARDGRP